MRIFEKTAGNRDFFRRNALKIWQIIHATENHLKSLKKKKKSVIILLRHNFKT